MILYYNYVRIFVCYIIVLQLYVVILLSLITRGCGGWSDVPMTSSMEPPCSHGPIRYSIYPVVLLYYIIILYVIVFNYLVIVLTSV